MGSDQLCMQQEEEEEEQEEEQEEWNMHMYHASNVAGFRSGDSLFTSDLSNSLSGQFVGSTFRLRGPSEYIPITLRTICKCRNRVCESLLATKIMKCEKEKSIF